VNLIASLDALRSRHDVLRHPFYQRWSAGELTRAELAHYAGQYRHAVLALAQASAHAASAVDPDEDADLRARLETHAQEEASHVELWDDFCSAVGARPSDAPAPETVSCVRAWAGRSDRGLLCSLVALYAIEAGQPAIAQAKRAGLVAHYGVEEGPATAYFELHERLDVEHAASSRELIEARQEQCAPHTARSEADVDRLLDEAEAVLRGNWELLDGVERAVSMSA
jgi:pyrroloquinoline-quinone synthase